MHRLLSLHTLDLSITTDLEAVGPMLDRCYTSSVLPGVRSSLALDLRCGAIDSFRRPGGIFAETTLFGARCYYHGGTLFGEGEQGGVGFEYELETDRLRIRLMDAYREQPHQIAIDVFRPLLQSFLLPLHGLKSLHGAVVARGDSGVFLAGRGGTGKSTTAIAAWRAGWNVLSDDGPLFTLLDGRAQALSSLDFVHVTGDTLALFPELVRHQIGDRDSRGKFAIDGCVLATPRSRQEPVAITHYVELHRTDVATPRVEPLDGNATLRALIAEQMFVVRSRAIRAADPRLSRMSELILELLTSFTSCARFHRLLYADVHLPLVPPLLEAL